jgi:hypothetical protein
LFGVAADIAHRKHPEDILFTRIVQHSQFTIFGEFPHDVRNYRYIADRLGNIEKNALLNFVLEASSMEDIVQFIQNNPSGAGLIRMNVCDKLEIPNEEDASEYCRLLTSIVENTLSKNIKLHSFDRTAPVTKDPNNKQARDDHDKAASMRRSGRDQELEAFFQKIGHERVEGVYDYARLLIQQRNGENASIADNVMKNVGSEQTVIFYGDGHVEELAALLGRQKVIHVRLSQNQEREKEFLYSRQQMHPIKTFQDPDLIRYSESGLWVVTPTGQAKGLTQLFLQSGLDRSRYKDPVATQRPAAVPIRPPTP